MGGNFTCWRQYNHVYLTKGFSSVSAMLLVSSCVPVSTWLCSRVMRFQSRPTNWPLLTIESPVAQVVRASDQITEGRWFKSHLGLGFFFRVLLKINIMLFQLLQVYILKAKLLDYYRFDIFSNYQFNKTKWSRSPESN